MVKEKVIIKNPSGLHLRPAGMFCKAASNYPCSISFTYRGDSVANAKSVLSVLGACVKCGDEIEITCDGELEDEALAEMIVIVGNGLGE